jgi:hypothetical protein
VKTAAERKAAERARRDAQGLKRYEFWLLPVIGEKVKQYIERLAKRRNAK